MLARLAWLAECATESGEPPRTAREGAGNVGAPTQCQSSKKNFMRENRVGLLVVDACQVLERTDREVVQGEARGDGACRGMSRSGREEIAAFAA
jgi:hypothetical protein